MVGNLQEVFDMLHAMKDDQGWTVIMQTANEGETRRRYVGIKKGLLILELSE